MRDFLRQAFSETKPDGSLGTPSFSRLATGFLAVFCAGWISAAVTVAAWHNFKNPLAAPWQILPDPGTFAGIAAFCATLYGINRGTAFFGTK